MENKEKKELHAQGNKLHQHPRTRDDEGEEQLGSAQPQQARVGRRPARRRAPSQPPVAATQGSRSMQWRRKVADWIRTWGGWIRLPRRSRRSQGGARRRSTSVAAWGRWPWLFFADGVEGRGRRGDAREGGEGVVGAGAARPDLDGLVRGRRLICSPVRDQAPDGSSRVGAMDGVGRRSSVVRGGSLFEAGRPTICGAQWRAGWGWAADECGAWWWPGRGGAGWWPRGGGSSEGWRVVGRRGGGW